MSEIKVELVDYMGSDLTVVNAARVSFDKTSEWGAIEGDDFSLSIPDAKLVRYLASHDHWTPFAHTAIQFRVSAPVPIRTQCFKHKIGLVENEESRRYITSRPEIYIPETFREKPEGSIKQGSAGMHPNSEYWLEEYEAQTKAAVDLYMRMLEAGVCPEQARFVLPQGAVVNWIWTGNLISFANLVNKRSEPNAQYEVKLVALQIDKLIAPLFPVSWAALVGKDKNNG